MSAASMTNNDDTIKAYGQHRTMEHTRSYLDRGRSFQNLAEDKLNEEWAAAFIALCADGDQTRARLAHDLNAEIGLRKLKEPMHLVSHAMDRIRQNIRRIAEEDLERIEGQIGAFLGDLEKPKN
jgi:hypothetical protein